MLRDIHMYEYITKLKGLIIPLLTLTLFCHCGVFRTWFSGLHIEVLRFCSKARDNKNMDFDGELQGELKHEHA